jgi:hypothetical protein
VLEFEGKTGSSHILNFRYSFKTEKKLFTLGQDPFCRDQQKSVMEQRISSTYSLLKGHLLFAQHYLLNQGRNAQCKRLLDAKLLI